MNRTATAAIGSLASLAVLGMAAPALAAPVAAESNGTTTSVLCGTPTQDAVYETVTVPARVETVEHAAEFETVPAVTRSEWRWTRDLDVLAHEYELRTPQAMVEWQYDAGELHVWEKRTLVTQPSPAVPATSYMEEREVMVTEYRFRQRNRLEELPEGAQGNGPQDNNGVGADDKWIENPQWNAEGVPVSVGWVYMNETRRVPKTELVKVDVPGKDAVEAKYDVEETESATAPGPEWTKIATISGLAKQLLPEGEEPDEDGWSKTGVTLPGKAPDKVTTKFAEEAPGGGWKATGESKVVRTVPESTDTHSATPPAGDGWRKLADSETVVTVAPATKVQTKAAWTEQKVVAEARVEKVKVKDAVPAGPACETDANTDDEPAPVVDVPPAQVPVPPVVAIDPPVVGETPVVVTQPVVVPEQPVVETPAPEVPVAEVPAVEVPAPPIVLGEEVQAPVAPEEDTTAPAVLGVEAKAAPIQAVVKTTTETPRRGTVAVPTSVDAGLSVTAPAPGTDWRKAAGLVALAAGTALYAVPTRRRATAR